MSSRLCAFASSGNPNAEGLTIWNSSKGKALIMGNKESVEANPSALKMWVTMFTNKAPGE
jgi:hypothetical protein